MQATVIEKSECVGAGCAEGEETTTWMLQGLIHAAITMGSISHHN